MLPAPLPSHRAASTSPGERTERGHFLLATQPLKCHLGIITVCKPAQGPGKPPLSPKRCHMSGSEWGQNHRATGTHPRGGLLRGAWLLPGLLLTISFPSPLDFLVSPWSVQHSLPPSPFFATAHVGWNDFSLSLPVLFFSTLTKINPLRYLSVKARAPPLPISRNPRCPDKRA